MINIVVPSAGRGSRMNSDKPKAFVDCLGTPLIEWALKPLRCLGARIIVIGLEEDKAYYKTLKGIDNIIYLDTVTEGGACTVLKARGYIDNEEPLIIVNNDQYVDFDALHWLASSAKDGSIVVCKKDDPKYSYAVTDMLGKVIMTVEKEVLSNNAMLGYNFYRRGSDFVKAAEKMIMANDRVKGEFYTAPVYNYIIDDGADINVYKVSGNNFYNLGTAKELELSIERLKNEG